MYTAVIVIRDLQGNIVFQKLPKEYHLDVGNGGFRYITAGITESGKEMLSLEETVGLNWFENTQRQNLDK
jgi:hypothetical protein